VAKLHITAESGRQDITFMRVFDAPRELVFKAWTDPAMLPKWLGPRRLTMTLIEMDARPGGSWRYVSRDVDGSEYGFHGVFHDVAPPERVVQTFEFEGVPGHVSLDTIRFEDIAGQTRIAGQSVFQSVEDRDGMVQSGMEGGMSEGFDRLDELLQVLTGAAE
jgi:uncharacterized protein YndB with AHSA1/START domain